jgi:hypothetical protein
MSERRPQPEELDALCVLSDRGVHSHLLGGSFFGAAQDPKQLAVMKIEKSEEQAELAHFEITSTSEPNLCLHALADL